MVKIAKTEEEIKKCMEYLQLKGTPPLTRSLIYTEDSEGNITGVCGITVIPAIEPMQAENKLHALELYNFAQGVIVGQGSKIMQVITNKHSVQHLLIEKLGFQLWTDSIKQYIKEV